MVGCDVASIDSEKYFRYNGEGVRPSYQWKRLSEKVIFQSLEGVCRYTFP